MAAPDAIANLRAAIYTALNGVITYPVYHIPPSSAGDHVVIDSIRSHETTAQTWRSFEAYVTLQIISQYQKTGNRTDGYAEAEAIKQALRPTVTGAITVTGYDVAGCWEDDRYEDLASEGPGKYHRVTLIYFYNLIADSTD